MDRYRVDLAARSAPMNNDDIDSFLIRSGVPYDQVGKDTWVLRPETAHRATLAVSVRPPIVLFSIQLFSLTEVAGNREQLFRTMLELNAELLHSSYSLQEGHVVLSGAHPLENLDYNEFQAVVDDLCMALDHHINKIAAIVRGSSNEARS